jgi:type VI secretion system protein ImpA
MDTINSRQDVTRILDQICLYYEKNEPASPVPLLLKRAARLVDKDFFEIIQDVAPESVDQIQKLIGGAKDKVS